MLNFVSNSLYLKKKLIGHVIILYIAEMEKCVTHFCVVVNATWIGIGESMGEYVSLYTHW